VASIHKIPLSQDAALVATLAGTAMPFSHSAEDEAERWLRVLRLHGRVGNALQALGVGEAALPHRGPDTIGSTPPFGDQAIEWVVARAEEFAAERNADSVGTTDLLYALFETYDRLLDDALSTRGASRDELIERLSG
jgi:hypothetical protein